jgi:hypothetical protein
MQPITSIHPSSTWSRCNIRDGVTCTTRRCASTSHKARLGNPSVTFFQAKQATRSQRVSRAILPPSILWRNWQTEACMVLRRKPRNHHDDFEAQITKPELPVLRPKPEKPTYRFWGQTRENRPSGFEAKPLTNRHPWFWGSTKKPSLLISSCTVQTTHSVTRPLDRPATEYLNYETIPGPLHQVSYSCHDPRRYTQCRTCHLHTTRQANVVLQQNKE